MKIHRPRKPRAKEPDDETNYYFKEDLKECIAATRLILRQQREITNEQERLTAEIRSILNEIFRHKSKSSDSS